MAGAHAGPGADPGGVAAAAAERLERGRLLFAGPVTFEKSAPSMAHLPEDDRPEVAMAGRSNVGKSSLINAVTGRNGLARASSEPGRTRELNSFLIGDGLRLMDMPGYGYAKAPKTEVERWTTLVRDYLRGRPSLSRVFLLVDSRHGLKPNDKAVMDVLDQCAVSYQIVLTKTDKLKRGEAEAVHAATTAAVAKRPAAFPGVLAVSAQTGDGVPELRAAMADLA